MRMPLQGELKASVINPRWIVVSRVPLWNPINNSFSERTANPVEAERGYNYSITDKSSGNDGLGVFQAGLKRRVVYAPLPTRANDLRIFEQIYIRTAIKLEQGQKYELKIKHGVFGKEIELVFFYDPDQFSRVAHIDPYGFSTGDQKKFYLGLNMGSAGEFIPDSEFEVIDWNTWKTVFRGRADKVPYIGWSKFISNDPYSDVYVGDFSELKTEGKYVIKHNTGYSYPFYINDGIYRVTLNTLALGMYHQRRGEDILSKYTRFARKSTIEGNTTIYKTDKLDPFIKKLLSKMDGEKKNIIYNSNSQGKKISFESGGHMDAGDYSPYSYNSSLLIFNLITSMDFFGNQLAHDNLGLPESGDGIPDILQEAILEVNWLKGMQDPEDGGVYTMTKPYGRSYQNTMPGENPHIKRYAAPKDTTATGAFAAALARTARSKFVNTYYSNLIKELTEKAEKAWKFLEKNEGFHGFHHYGKENQEKDERVWAALELYALTGKEKYKEYFEEYHEPGKRANGVEWMNHSYGNSNRTVALWNKNDVPYKLNPFVKKACQQRFHDYLELTVKNSKNMPYGVSFHEAYRRHYTIGWFFPVNNYSVDLLMGAELYDNNEYRFIALQQLHYTLGANPLNRTFISGLGYNRLQSIVDQKSLYDGITEPVIGIPVSPITTGYTYNGKYGRQVHTLTYPPAKYNTKEKDWDKKKWSVYGILELPFDGWNLKGEMTIEKLGNMLCAAAAVTPVVEAQFPVPFFKLVTQLDDSSKVIKTSVIFEDYKPASAYYTWYMDGVPVSSDPYFEFSPEFYPEACMLGLEVMDLNGKRFYRETVIPGRKPCDKSEDQTKSKG